MGAFIGPVILFLINIIKGTDDLISTYRLCFIVLGIPAVITISLVLLAKLKYPNPEIFEKEVEQHKEFSFQKSFVLYMVAICLFAFGFADFTIITFHVARVNVFDISNLSLLYALAMAVDAIAGSVFGWLFDKVGLKALMLSTFLSAFFSAFIFLTESKSMIITGIVLWGIGMGTQESIMKAEVSKIIPKSSRSMGFGIFETGFGVAWFWEVGYWDTSTM